MNKIRREDKRETSLAPDMLNGEQDGVPSLLLYVHVLLQFDVGGI